MLQKISLTVCILLLLVATSTQASRDWSKIKVRNLYAKVNEEFRKTGTSGRIVGGVEVEPNSLPYQAALFINTPQGTFFCGGSLISNRYILTAAHCLDNATNIEVVLGAHNVYDQYEPQQVHMTSKEFVQHADWSENGFLNDIAAIKLPESVKLSQIINTINLPAHAHASETFENEMALVSGWGKTSDDIGGVTETLRSLKALVTTNKYCENVFPTIIKPMHLCTSGEGVKSTCMGDSGGPLVIDGALIGIVSFGSIYCELEYPSGYTRITSFLDWIEKNTDVHIDP